MTLLTRFGYCNVHAFDISHEKVRQCHARGFAFVRAFDALKLESLPGPAEFDAIFLLDALEHIPKHSVPSVLEQARHRLRAGGALVIQTPNMGSLLAGWMRYGDWTHEFGLTESSALDLLRSAGFDHPSVEIRPALNATTILGGLREWYLSLLHGIVFLSGGAQRPRIASKNLLIRAVRGPQG